MLLEVEPVVLELLKLDFMLERKLEDLIKCFEEWPEVLCFRLGWIEGEGWAGPGW